jgi:predicted MPP superfamily phosphohydrolase
LIKAVSEHFSGVPGYAILGNAEHKLMLAERKQFVAEIEALGIRVMLNEHQEIILRDEPVNLVAVDDPYYGYADLPVALEGMPPTSERFTLLLAHSPQIATQAARAGIDLMLSGHTHGGQVRLPLVGPLKTQNPLCRRLDMGLFDRQRLTDTLGYDPGGDLTVYITRGIGLANLPGIVWAAPRFLCRPEVTLLTLQPRYGSHFRP